MRAHSSSALSHQGGRKKRRLRVPGGLLQPEAVALIVGLQKPGELRRVQDAGGGGGVAKKCPLNRCNSNRDTTCVVATELFGGAPRRDTPPASYSGACSYR